MTIAGSDPSGGAGLQQDLKVFSMLGVAGGAAVTALTVQNSSRVSRILPMDPGLVEEQVEAAWEELAPVAVKTGMLPTPDIIRGVGEVLARHPEALVVVDPVLASSAGPSLTSSGVAEAIREHLYPVAHVITPNIPEAQVLSETGPITDFKGMRRAASRILDQMRGMARLEKGPGPAVVLKGGHLPSQHAPVDLLMTEAGARRFQGKRRFDRGCHGTGCLYSAAICGVLARGKGLEYAVSVAREMVELAMARGLEAAGKDRPAAVNPLDWKERGMEREQVREGLEEGWRLLSSRPAAEMVPEIRLNIGYALPGAVSTEEVAAFPGRITTLGRSVARVAPPEFGASSHVARIILTAMETDPDCRSAMNLRYDPVFLRRAEEAGLSAAEFSRDKEPEEVRLREGSSLSWGVKEAIASAGGRVPDLIHDKGGIGKEPIIRVLGPDPVTVIKKGFICAGIPFEDRP